MIDPFNPMNDLAILVFAALFGVGLKIGLSLGEHLINKKG